MSVQPKICSYIGFNMTKLSHHDVVKILKADIQKARDLHQLTAENYLWDFLIEFSTRPYEWRILPDENCTEVHVGSYCADFMTGPNCIEMRSIYFNDYIDDEFFRVTRTFDEAYHDGIITKEQKAAYKDFDELGKGEGW